MRSQSVVMLIAIVAALGLSAIPTKTAAMFAVDQAVEVEWTASHSDVASRELLPLCRASGPVSLTATPPLASSASPLTCPVEIPSAPDNSSGAASIPLAPPVFGDQPAIM